MDLPWMTDIMKSKLKERSYLTKTYCKYRNRKSDFEKLFVKTNDCVAIILAAKDKYIIRIIEKLNDPIMTPKIYMKIINRFLSNKRIPAIPLLLVNGEITSNFSQEASIVSDISASQSTPLQNSSILLTFYRTTEETLSS